MYLRLLNLSVAMLVPALPGAAQTLLPEFTVTGARVANLTSVGTIDMPVSSLRFEPRVDVQARNLAEAQADVAIRGGLFEGTGFQVAGAPLGDPQTGHYAAELPVPPAMLSAPRVVTGLEHAVAGFQATAGGVRYDWTAVAPRRLAAVAFGSDGYGRQSLYAAAVGSGATAGWSADAEWARSEGDGSLPAGDHDFQRVAGRLQWRRAGHQTDLFAGYQAKFFGWPNLYTPFGFNETENLQAVLLLASHRWTGPEGDAFTATVFHRRHKDDYEFNRAVPGASNPFQHTTWVRGGTAAGRWQTGLVAWNYSLSAVADRIESTSLTFGRFRDRRLAKASVLPEWSILRDDGEFVLRAGGSWDDSNRDGSVVSPLAGAQWRQGGLVVYAELAESAQLPTYTALNSSASAGLFRGNPNLGWTRSRNLEAGLRGAVRGWRVEAAVFERDDRDLVDWTFRRGVTARTANAVDVRTRGFEAIASRRVATFELVLGYSALAKRSDYGTAAVDASFYALNFPRHRATAAVTWRFAPEWEVRADNEYRIQKENLLRLQGGDDAWLSSFGLYLTPASLPGWEFSALVDNAWSSAFQEVPAVPAAGRQWAVGATRRW
jgi:vitamin B12 transporter